MNNSDDIFLKKLRKTKNIQMSKITKKINSMFISIIYLLTSLIFFILCFILRIVISFFSKNIKSKNIPIAIDGVSFIIPTWNKKEMVTNCIKILDHYLTVEKKYIKKEIIIIENGSTDGTAEALKDLKTKTPLIVLKQKTNLGFAKAINLGAKKAKYNYIYLLNNDIEVQKNFFVNIIECAQKLISNKILFFGIASQIFFYDKSKRREESGKTSILPKHGSINVFHYTLPDILNQNSYTLYPGGGSSLLNKQLFNTLGGYDFNSYKPLYCEDLDLGFNAWKLGLPSYYCARSQVIHHHRSSSKLISYNPDYFMYKNWTVFCLKNFNSLKNVIRHMLLYPIIIFKNNNHKNYALDAFSNLKNIFLSKIRLYKYRQVYSDKLLINFPLFETKL